MLVILFIGLSWDCVMTDGATKDAISFCETVSEATSTIVETDSPSSLSDATNRLVAVLSGMKDPNLRALIAKAIGSATTNDQRLILDAVRLLEIRPSDEVLKALTDSIDRVDGFSRVAAVRYLADYVGNRDVDESLARMVSQAEDIAVQLNVAAALLEGPRIHPATSRLVQDIFDRGGLRYQAIAGDFLIQKSVRGEILTLCAEAEYVSNELAAEARSLTSAGGETALAANLYLAVYEAKTGGDPEKYFIAIVETAKDVDKKLQPLAVSMSLNEEVVPTEIRNEVFALSINSSRKETRAAALKSMIAYVGDSVSVADVVRSVDDEDLATLFRELEHVDLSSDALELLEQRVKNAADPVETVFLSRILFTSLLRNLNGVSDDKLTSFLIGIRRAKRGSLVADSATQALLVQKSGLRDSLRQDDVSKLLRKRRELR